MSKIKRGTEVSFPVPVFLLFFPIFFLPLSFHSNPHFVLRWWFHSFTVFGLEVSHFGSFHLSISQTLLVSLQHSRHWLFGPLSLWPQSCSWFPATTNHHLEAVAGGGEAVVRRRWRASQIELMQGGGEMWRQAAAVLATTHVAPLRLEGTDDKWKKTTWARKETWKSHKLTSSPSACKQQQRFYLL